MKYYLKPHVTDEMLKAVGFSIFSERKVRSCGNICAWIFIENSTLTVIHIDKNIILDVSSYIQDLIDLDYVEVVE